MDGWMEHVIILCVAKREMESASETRLGVGESPEYEGAALGILGVEVCVRDLRLRNAYAVSSRLHPEGGGA
jgi:hypothetical protein